MGRTFIAGGALILAGVVAIVLDSLLGLGLGFVLFGIALGGVLGLSRDGTPLGRLGAYSVGFVIVVIAYLGRVLVGNASTLGLIIGVVAVILPVAAVSALTRNRLPLSAGLLGVATVVGAYEAAFLASPQNIQSELLPVASAAIFPVALGFLAAVWFSLPGDEDDGALQSAAPSSAAPDYEPYGPPDALASDRFTADAESER